MSDQVIIKHKSNHKQLNESQDKYQGVEVNKIKIDYIKPGHEKVQLLIEYYNAIPTTSTHKIYTKSTSVVPHRPYPTTTLWGLHSMLRMKSQGIYL